MPSVHTGLDARIMPGSSRDDVPRLKGCRDLAHRVLSKVGADHMRDQDEDDDRDLMQAIRDLQSVSRPSESQELHRLTLELTYELKDVKRRLRRVEEGAGGVLKGKALERWLVIGAIAAAVMSGQFDLSAILASVAPATGP